MPSLCHAQTTAYAADQSGNPNNLNSLALSIPVKALVSPSCTTASPSTSALDLGTLDRILPTTQVVLDIQCSGAFHMGLSSSNGGLKSAATPPVGYTNRRDYAVALHLLDNANTDYVSLTCAASELTLSAAASDCSASLRGPATSLAPGFKVNGASNGKASYLLISNAPLSANILVAATDYVDTLTISVTAAT